MKIYFATDHSGFELKESLVKFVRDEMGYEVEDCGALTYDAADDYPVYIKRAAIKVSKDPAHSRAIILGASGQGEAMVANRVPHVRAAVCYGRVNAPQIDADGAELNLVASTRQHNDANVLSIGARFIDETTAREIVEEWLLTPFSEDERHVRRIKMIDSDV